MDYLQELNSLKINFLSKMNDAINCLSIIAIMMLFIISPVQGTNKPEIEYLESNQKNMDTATFGAGCFWCVEAIFQEVEGVISVASGYEGGRIGNPTYKEVCSGLTGHAEVIQIIYDPAKVSYKDLLEVFWQVHDPTTKDRQGNDAGTQYRSVIFYHTEEQKALAEKYKKELDASGAWNKPVVTEISPATKFYKAEDYHQNYYKLNGSQPYCTFVVRPKIEKFRKVFKDKLKK
jgi:peptide-methionine (S)-S-oxide reductase